MRKSSIRSDHVILAVLVHRKQHNEWEMSQGGGGACTSSWSAFHLYGETGRSGGTPNGTVLPTGNCS